MKTDNKTSIIYAWLLFLSVSPLLLWSWLMLSEQEEIESLMMHREITGRNSADLSVIQRTVGEENILGFVFNLLQKQVVELASNIPDQNNLMETNEHLQSGISSLLRQPAFSCLDQIRFEYITIPLRVEDQRNADSAPFCRHGQHLGLAGHLSEISHTLISHAERGEIISSGNSKDLAPFIFPHTVKKRFRQLFKQPLIISEFLDRTFRQVRILPSEDGPLGFFWNDDIEPKGRWRLLTLCIFSLPVLPHNYSDVAFSNLWDLWQGQDGSALAFVHINKNETQAISTSSSSRFSAYGSITHLFSGPPPFVIEHTGLPDGIISRVALDQSGTRYAAVLRTVPDVSGSFNRLLRFVVIPTIAAILLWFLVKTCFLHCSFSGGLKVKILTVFLLVTLFPVIAGLTMATARHRENLEQTELRARHFLRQSLFTLDANIDQAFLKVLQAFRKTFKSREFKSQYLQATRRMGHDHRTGDELLRRVMKAFLRQSSSASFSSPNTASVATACPATAAQTLALPQNTSSATTIPLDNLIGFFLFPEREQELAGSATFGRKRIGKEITNAFKELANMAFQEWKGTQEKKRNHKQRIGIDIASDEIINVFFDFIGAEKIIDAIVNFDHLITFANDREQCCIFTLALDITEQLSHFLFVIFASNHVTEPYLRDCLADSHKVSDNVFLTAMNREQRRYIGSATRVDPTLHSLVQTCQQTSIAVTEVDHQTNSVWAAVPGNSLDAYILAGKYDYSFLLEQSENAANWFWMMLAVVVMVSFVLAVGGATFFLWPIRRLTHALNEVNQGNLAVSLNLPERNEFGRLATAFNSMVLGLRQGKVLGRYVSEQVRQAVQHGDMQQLAGETRQINATVLFVGLVGFPQIMLTRSGTWLSEVLGLLLHTTNSVMTARKGEIDKMIGEKILVVFDHRRFSDSGQAAESAVAAAEELSTLLSERLVEYGTISPVTGISTGKVLSGILGAPQVRLDYTVIGDTVNLASRLLSLAYSSNCGEVILDGETCRAALPRNNIRKLAVDRVKGKTRSVEVYCLETGKSCRTKPHRKDGKDTA